ncbi:hypothetical protein [Pisciglobus halotolerans]|uniref:hypothetical protein n=1 Tax=Pisciglobus halotolerans TaxID=745365 RepID=UPI000B84D845|nr:hypothetical protein [Pisciglobus halotolerans]
MLKLPRKPPSKLRQAWTYVKDRRASFSFTIGSVGYGCYHFFNSKILIHSDAYKTLDALFGFVGGRFFGLVFIVLGCLKLYGIISDKTMFKLPLYFALLFLWFTLAICFFISFLQGNQNSLWIYSFIIVGMSTSILMPVTTVIEGEDNG